VRLPAPRQLIHQPPRAAVEVGDIHGRRRVMGSSAKKRQTFSKMSRDRELKEKREAKRQKKGTRRRTGRRRPKQMARPIRLVTTRPLLPTIVNDVER
jgi:hypothetical protein